MREVIDACLVQRAAGQSLPDAVVIARYPELMPELDDELKRIRLIAGARQRVDGNNGSVAAANSTPRNASDSSIRLQCPHCQAGIFLAADASWSKVNCSECGQELKLVGDDIAASRLRPGSTVGRFELLECIGSGGFGVVWKARDPQLDRMVALKVPRRGELSNGETELFFREARAAAQVRHPNIVSIHEVGRDGDTVYLVSDFVDGSPLSESCKKQRLSIREAAMLCRQVAEALAHIHERGIVHRDLKPANVMVTKGPHGGGQSPFAPTTPHDHRGDGARTVPEGYGLQPHLTDFGLARRAANEVTMTADGQLMGTPAYMSPEQASGGGHAAGPASDVYSLGVILFELLTGEPPFRGAPTMVIDQVLHDEPMSPRRLNAVVPRDLETITVKCLEKDPAKRYASAQALADDLDRWLRGDPIIARPLGRIARTYRWCRRHPVATIIALVLVVGGPTVGLITTTLARQASTARQTAESAKQRTRQVLYASTMRNVQSAMERQDFSRAEELLLGLRPSDGQPDLRSFPWYYWWRRSRDGWRRNDSGLIATIPLPPNEDVNPEVMANLRLAVERSLPHVKYPSGLLKRVTVPLNLPAARPWSISIFAPEAESSHGGKLSDAAVSADELMLATCGRDGTVQVWDYMKVKRATLRAMSPAPFERVGISTKGTFVAATTHHNADANTWNSQIHVWNVTSGEIHRHWELPNVRCLEVEFSPDEKELAVGGGAAPVLFNLESGEQRRLTPPGPKVTDCYYSPDGRQMVGLSNDSNDMWLWDLATGEIHRTLSPPSHQYAATFFPTAQQLVSTNFKTIQLWNIGEDDAPLHLSEPQALRRLAFTEDGRLISETSYRRISVWDPSDGRRIHNFGPELRRMSLARRANVIAAGCENDVVLYSPVSGQRLHTLRGHTRPVGSCDIGASGRFVASGDADSDDPAVAILWDAKSGKLMHRLPGHFREVKALAVAPDDRTLITVDGDRVLRTWDVTTGELILSTDVYREIWGGRGVQQLLFNRGGTILYACAIDGIQEIDPSTGKLRRKLADGIVPVGYFCLSPDGTTLAVARGNWEEDSSDEGVVELWDLASGELITSLTEEYGSAICVAFSPDGRTLATGHRSGKIALWQAATEDEVRRQSSH